MPAFDELCSAELFHIKLMIPCNPVDYLNNEYGPFSWLKPISKKYLWTNLKYSGTWTDYEWIRAIKVFYQNGSLNRKLTLRNINRYFRYHLFQLPSEDFE